MALDPDLHRLATSGAFAALTTLGPDGMPSTHVMWVDADDDHLVINTEVHRQKFKNTSRDPRVAITVMDPESPYRFIEARGRVVGTVGGKAAREHIDVLSHRYMGGAYANAIQSERVILQVDVEKLHIHGY
jgi:PPOX class probable F420-dependent enzyme